MSTSHRPAPTRLAPGTFNGGTLDVDVRLRRGSFQLDVAFRAEPGEVVAVLGPNGAGKSTVLGIISGVVTPDEGTVRLGDRVLTGPGVALEPEVRRVGLMGQDPLLFPHLSALENVAFGPRAQGRPKAQARREARAWIDRVGLAGFAHRKPAQLSGGQRQRIALARALAAEPELVLLDEPLGALDAQTAPEIRHVLRTHLRAARLTALVVTHDVLDAAMLADRILVLSDGAIVDSGPTATVLTTPRSTFSAALAGLNVVTGVTSSAAAPGAVATVDTAVGPTATVPRPGGPASLPGAEARLRDAAASQAAGAAVRWHDAAASQAAGAAASRSGEPSGPQVSGIAAEALAAGDPAIAVFAPSAVAVYLASTAGSPRNTWPATVVDLEAGPSAIRVRAALAGAVGAAGTIAADLTPASVAELGLSGGTPVYLSVKATEVRVHLR